MLPRPTNPIAITTPLVLVQFGEGIVATTDRDAVLALEAECCIYMPRATGSGQTRAGLSEPELVADVVALLERRINVVTTCTNLFARGARLSDENRALVLDACAKGNASLWASGSDPGFIAETLMLALLSVQRDVELIEIEEFGDLSRRPSRHMVMDQMGFGRPLEEFDPDRRKNHLFGEYQPALTVLADAAGLDIDEWSAEGGWPPAVRIYRSPRERSRPEPLRHSASSSMGAAGGTTVSGSFSTASSRWT